ncbi:VRR-NUC domain-containing protein [Nissabacter sp. SGAir0207]|uniref:VRR-NUC domain-containing protein n=1 Tax=Nissabacter sp. SGAir0207 TaxID=2126321 RepID=UPI0010CD13BC|nr:VRR-NUC domain-containing protein [Nissabacter sp. SGAir0207]QCR38797.1 norphogenetic protein [Nissabacter sp. SGAir0207]
MFRITEDWLKANNRDASGKLVKGKKLKPKNELPDLTTRLKSPLAQLNALEDAFAVSVHEKALIQLGKKPDLLKGNYEHYDQVRIFDYMYRHHRDIYDLLHATPNGGLRSQKTANDLNAEGVKKGYPDVTLDAARGIYHGLRFELKYGTNKPSAEQLDWQVRLRAQGYVAEVVWGWEEAVALILRYWLLEPGQALPAAA